MKTSLSSKGRIVIPAALRELDHLRPGQRFEIERIKAGEYRLKTVVASRESGLLKWLRSCPVQGWFQPIASESTADL